MELKKEAYNIGDLIDHYQEWVDYDMKHYGKISDETNRDIKEAGLQIVKDEYGDYEVIAGKYDEELNKNSKVFDSVLQGFKEFGELTDNKELLKRIDETKTAEAVDEDVVKKANGKWTNRGDDGKEHGEFDTKAEAEAQMRAMYARGYKGESITDKQKLKIDEDQHDNAIVEKDFENPYARPGYEDMYIVTWEDSERNVRDTRVKGEYPQDAIDKVIDSRDVSRVLDCNKISLFTSPQRLRNSESLKESTNESSNDYKIYTLSMSVLVPNDANLARTLSPNSEAHNEIVHILRKNGFNLANEIIDYKESPELTKQFHDMGIVHGNNTIDELTDKVLKKLDDNGYDISDKYVKNYAEAAAELIANDINQDVDAWYSETLINYPEDLEELPKK